MLPPPQKKKPPIGKLKKELGLKGMGVDLVKVIFSFFSQSEKKTWKKTVLKNFPGLLGGKGFSKRGRVSLCFLVSSQKGDPQNL